MPDPQKEADLRVDVRRMCENELPILILHWRRVAAADDGSDTSDSASATSAGAAAGAATASSGSRGARYRAIGYRAIGCSCASGWSCAVGSIGCSRASGSLEIGRSS